MHLTDHKGEVGRRWTMKKFLLSLFPYGSAGSYSIDLTSTSLSGIIETSPVILLLWQSYALAVSKLLPAPRKLIKSSGSCPRCNPRKLTKSIMNF